MTVARLAECAHLPAAEAAPRAAECEACGARSSLRACVACGHVGCCESQRGHNTAHAKASGHPVIRQVRAGGGGWLWCYACDDYLE